MGIKFSHTQEDPPLIQPRSPLINSPMVSPRMDEITKWLDTFPTADDVKIVELKSKIQKEIRSNPKFLDYFNSNGDTIMIHILKTKPSTLLLSTIYQIDHGMLLKCSKDHKVDLRVFSSSPLLTALEYQVPNVVLEWLFDYNVSPLGEFDLGYHTLALLLGSQMFDQSRLERFLPYIAHHIDESLKNFRQTAKMRSYQNHQDSTLPIDSVEARIATTAKAWDEFATVMTKYATPTCLNLHLDLYLLTNTHVLYPTGIASYIRHPSVKGVNALMTAANAFAPGVVFELLCKNGALLESEQQLFLTPATRRNITTPPAISYHQAMTRQPNTLGVMSQNNYQAAAISILCSMGHRIPQTFIHTLKCEHIIRNYQTLSVHINHTYYSIIEALQDHPHPLIAQWFLPHVRRGFGGRYGDHEDLSNCSPKTLKASTSGIDKDPRELMNSIWLSSFNKRSAKYHYSNQHTQIYNLRSFGLDNFGQIVAQGEIDGCKSNGMTKADEMISTSIDYFGFYLFNRYPDLWGRNNNAFWKQYQKMDPLWDKTGKNAESQLKTSVLVHLAGNTYLTEIQKKFPQFGENWKDTQALQDLQAGVEITFTGTQDETIAIGEDSEKPTKRAKRKRGIIHVAHMNTNMPGSDSSADDEEMSDDDQNDNMRGNYPPGSVLLSLQKSAGESPDSTKSRVVDLASHDVNKICEKNWLLLSKLTAQKPLSSSKKTKSQPKPTYELAKANFAYYLTINSEDDAVSSIEMQKGDLDAFADLCTGQYSQNQLEDADYYISSLIPTDLPHSLHHLSILTQHFPISHRPDPTLGISSVFGNYDLVKSSSSSSTGDGIQSWVESGRISPDILEPSFPPFVLTSLSCQGYMPSYQNHNTSFLQYIYDTHPYMEYQEMKDEGMHTPNAEQRRHALLRSISIESNQSSDPHYDPVYDDAKPANYYFLDIYHYTAKRKFGGNPNPLLSPPGPPQIKADSKSLEIPKQISTTQTNDFKKKSRSAPHQFLSLTQLDQISIATSGVCFVDPTEVTQSQRDKTCSAFMTDLFRSKEYTQIENVLSIADQLSADSTLISGLDDGITTGDEQPQALPTSTVAPMNKHPYTPRCILNNTTTHRAPDNRHLTACSLIPSQYINYHTISNNYRGANAKTPSNSEKSQDSLRQTDINMPLPYLFDSYGIIQNFNPHNPPGIVWYLLLYAPVNNEDDMFDVLKRCRVDLVNQHYQTTLMYSVIRQSLPKIVQMFLSLTANPNQQDGYLRTVLHYISMTGYWHRFIYNKYQHMNYPKYASELVDFLYNVFYQYGCLVNVVDIGQHSPLSQAVLTGSPGEMLKMLFDFSISLTTKQSENQSTVFISRGMSDLDVPFTYGYSINCPSRDGYMKLIEKFNKETGLKKSEHVPLNTNCGDTQSLSSVSTLLSQLNSLIADQYPINPVPDWVDCHESLGFGTVLTPQQILQRQYAAGMVKIHQTIAILKITKALKGKQHQFTIEQIQQIISKPSSTKITLLSPSSNYTSNPQNSDENEQSPATKQIPTINQPYANLTFSSKFPDITNPPPQAWRTTSRINYEPSIPQPIYIHPELYTTGFINTDQQQGNEGDTSRPSSGPLLKKLTTTLLTLTQTQAINPLTNTLPPPPHPTKSLFGFRRGNNYTDVFFLLRPLYHNTATYSVHNQLSQDTMKKDLLKQIAPYSHQFSSSSTKTNPQLTQTYSIFDLMVFQTFMSHGIVNKNGNISIFSYPFAQFDATLASPVELPSNGSNWNPDIMRIWQEHCEPEYVIKPDVWSHFFATILFSFRLFVFFDQIRAVKTLSTPTSTAPSATPSPDRQTSKNLDAKKKHAMTIAATLENVERENVFMNTSHTFTTSLPGYITPTDTNTKEKNNNTQPPLIYNPSAAFNYPPSRHHLNLSDTIATTSRYSSTTSQLLLVTRTLDAYLETMVKLPGVIDECINFPFDTATSTGTATGYPPTTPTVEAPKAPSWAIQIHEANTKLTKYQDKIGMFSLKSALPPGLDKAFTHSSDVLEKGINTTLQSLVGNPDGKKAKSPSSSFPPEHLIWSLLTYLVFEVTVGTHRVPLNIVELAHWKNVTIPYWADQSNHQKSKYFSPNSMMLFAHLIFKSFISDGVKLATQWFQEYLDAFGQSL